MIFTQTISCSVIKNTNEHNPCDDDLSTVSYEYETLVKTDSIPYNFGYTIYSYKDSSIISAPIVYLIESKTRDTIQTLNNGSSKLNLKSGYYNLCVKKNTFQAIEITNIPVYNDSIELFKVFLGPDCYSNLTKEDLLTW